jgi:monoterpene epsilon-lactone hydrolase
VTQADNRKQLKGSTEMASHEHDALVAQLASANPGRKPTPEVRPDPQHFPAMIEMMDASALPIPPGISSEAATFGGVPGAMFEPAGADASRVILYFHGGGYMFGTARNTGHVTARLARSAGALGFSADYRLSWQAPFPAAVDDAVAAYRGLLASGFAPENVALAGDSAGGGLVLCALLALREAGDPLPAAGFASSAFTDLTVSGRSAAEVDDPIATRAGLQMLANGYLDGADARTPLASPLYADLAGLPPLLLQVGSRELLLDDTTRLAEAAKAAGVDVTADVLDDVIHIWQYFGPDLPETRDSERKAGEFLKRCWEAAAPQSPPAS